MEGNSTATEPRSSEGCISAPCNSCLWLTWETQRRNISLAGKFGCKYIEIDYNSYPRIIRYLLSLLATCHKVIVWRPRIIFAQCPSIVLCTLLAFVKKIFSFIFIVDAHNSAIEFIDSPYLVLRQAAAFVMRSADIVLVSNSQLNEPVARCGGNPQPLPDPLPEIARHPLPANILELPKPLITLISTFASDEPIATFLEAAESYTDKAVFLITGRKKKAGDTLRFAGPRILFTDFLSQEDYDALITHSALLVDLTTRENCLVCGAYEAIEAGIPAILSNSAALRETFRRGFLFADNTVSSYRTAIGRFLENPEQYARDIAEFRNEFLTRWEEYFRDVRATLEKLSK
jgi:glycosyltransferase involved in cell wall biosynthesis